MQVHFHFRLKQTQTRSVSESQGKQIVKATPAIDAWRYGQLPNPQIAIEAARKGEKKKYWHVVFDLSPRTVTVRCSGPPKGMIKIKPIVDDGIDSLWMPRRIRLSKAEVRFLEADIDSTSTFRTKKVIDLDSGPCGLIVRWRRCTEYLRVLCIVPSTVAI